MSAMCSTLSNRFRAWRYFRDNNVDQSRHCSGARWLKQTHYSRTGLHDWKVCVGLEDGRVFVLPFCVGYVIQKEHLYTEPTNWGLCIAKQAGWEVKQGAELRYRHCWDWLQSPAEPPHVRGISGWNFHWVAKISFVKACFCQIVVEPQYQNESETRRRSEIPGAWRLKVILGRQISSQSVKWLRSLSTDSTAKIRNKRWFMSYIFVFDCFESTSQIANGEQADEVPAR